MVSLESLRISIDASLHPGRIYMPQYWQDLQRRYQALSDFSQLDMCGDWAEKALQLLQQDGYGNKFQLVLVENGIDRWLSKIYSGIWYHAWLSSNTRKGVYIADGKSSQFDSKYRNGYFGYLSDAPSSLSIIYTHKAIKLNSE